MKMKVRGLVASSTDLPSFHYAEGWMGARADPNTVVKRISAPEGKETSDFPVTVLTVTLNFLEVYTICAFEFFLLKRLTHCAWL